jgi:hypothetical protein
LDIDTHEDILKSLYKHPKLEELFLNILDRNNSHPESYQLVKKYMLRGFEHLKLFYPDCLYNHQIPPSDYFSWGNRYEPNGDFFEKVIFRNLNFKFDLELVQNALDLIKEKARLPQEIIDIVYEYAYQDLLKV